MKYKNKKIKTDDGTFDSIKEYNRYHKLCLLQREGEISELKRQVKYVLIPTQKIDGKVVERECSYIADFVYKDNYLNKLIVEDTKGFKTKDYIIKRKLMLMIYGIRIHEI